MLGWTNHLIKYYYGNINSLENINKDIKEKVRN